MEATISRYRELLLTYVISSSGQLKRSCPSVLELRGRANTPHHKDQYVTFDITQRLSFQEHYYSSPYMFIGIIDKMSEVLFQCQM
jgi:hypothetical protein